MSKSSCTKRWGRILKNKNIFPILDILSKILFVLSTAQESLLANEGITTSITTYRTSS